MVGLGVGRVHHVLVMPPAVQSMLSGMLGIGGHGTPPILPKRPQGGLLLEREDGYRLPKILLSNLQPLVQLPDLVIGVQILLTQLGHQLLALLRQELLAVHEVEHLLAHHLHLLSLFFQLGVGFPRDPLLHLSEHLDGVFLGGLSLGYDGHLDVGYVPFYPLLETLALTLQGLLDREIGGLELLELGFESLHHGQNIFLEVGGLFHDFGSHQSLERGLHVIGHTFFHLVTFVVQNLHYFVFLVFEIFILLI